jgi:hypothetical protein
MRVRSLGSLGFAPALLLAVTLASCSSDGTGDGAQGHEFKNDSAGISMSVPEGWHATTRRFTTLLDPRERVVLTSFPVDGTTPSRNCSPDPLLREMPRSGVAAFLLEYMDDAARRHVDPRPDRFRLRGMAPGCCFWPPPERARAYAFNFGDNGRAFQLLLAVGKDATPGTRRLAAEVLDDIRIEPCDRPLPSDSKPRCRRPLPA